MVLRDGRDGGIAGVTVGGQIGEVADGERGRVEAVDGGALAAERVAQDVERGAGAVDEAEGLVGQAVEQAAARHQESLSVMVEQVGAVALETVHAHPPLVGLAGGDEKIQVGVNQRANGAEDVAARVEVERSFGGLVAAEFLARERGIENGFPMLQVFRRDKAEVPAGLLLILLDAVAGIDAHVNRVVESFDIPKTSLGGGDGLGRAPALRLQSQVIDLVGMVVEDAAAQTDIKQVQMPLKLKKMRVAQIPRVVDGVFQPPGFGIGGAIDQDARFERREMRWGGPESQVEAAVVMGQVRKSLGASIAVIPRLRAFEVQLTGRRK